MHGNIAVVLLNRPEVFNALDSAMVAEFEAALDAIEQDDAVRGFVLTGAGRGFCSGSDMTEQTLDIPARLVHMHQLVLRIMRSDRLSCAAFNGHAVGGGLELGLACTFRVAAPAAKVGLPEVRHGLMPSYGGTQLLPRLLGTGRALRLALTGELLLANDAEAIGLVDAVADQPVDAAVDLLARCTAGPPVAAAMIRRAILGGTELPLEEGLALERECALEVAASAGAAAGVAHFQEKRSARRQELN
jgi:enoyl-CoA hydratase/carnithine racemase